MLSLCSNLSYELCSHYVATVASPFRSSVFHILTKPSEICVKKTMKLNFIRKNVNNPAT